MTTHHSISIIKDTTPLSEDYIPTGFPGRGEQEQTLLNNLLPSLIKDKPFHTWVHGPPGSGKSSVVKSVLGKLEEHGFKTVYVNGWSAQTFFSVLDTILDELRALVGEKREIAFKFERLNRIAKENLLVIALDEVDQIFLKERNAALYNLFRLQNTGIICLSNSRAAFLALDPRVCSRFQPYFLEFPAYSEKQLVGILQERAERSLEPESWCKKDLERIGRSVEGDARIAIQALRVASYAADKQMASHIRTVDIKKGLRKSSELRKRYVLKSLSEHHRLLYKIVKDAQQITSAEIWKKYQAQACKKGLKPMARRTFNHYKQYLVRNRLLEERQEVGRRNNRVLRVVE